MYGLHKVSHFLTADGSGRDLNIMLDGGYKQGREYGTGWAAQDHPLFRTRQMNRILADDDDVTDVWGKKSLKGVSLQEAARQSVQAVPADWNKACFRSRGGHVLMLPRAARPDASLPPARNRHLVVPARSAEQIAGSPKVSLARAASAPSKSPTKSYKSRDTCISYDHWADKYPSSVQDRRSAKTRQDDQFKASVSMRATVG